ncbi:MAG TPA: L,D-transpeptidase family protein, partial [Nitrospirota bacterium]|nr:L,D-transpeptidase family protein [Nitrospirota bacterium]
ETVRLRNIYEKLGPFLIDPRKIFLVVSIETQTLLVCVNDTIIERYDASSSRFGTGMRENSLKTPLGIHRIKEKFGAGAPAGRIFKDRIDTGIDWDRRSTEDNLILTRILRLEGLEEGVNKGAGVDSYERYIYIHGTSREELIGTPLSHGCVCLRNLDIIRLFEIVKEGTLVYIDPPAIVIGGTKCRSVHFTGMFGSGMSALAQYLRFQGLTVSGSDRFHASEDTASIRQSLEGLGCAVVRQDGSGVGAGTDVVCVSTAIEESNPDIAAARSRGIPIIHRSDLLAAIIATKKTIAVAGTSGKSTVTAMIFEFLTACGRSPSLISGAGLRRLEKQELIGNAWGGGSDLLVVEADESDGTLVKYRPEVAIFLNISKDHKTIDELKQLFETLSSQTPWTASNADDPILASLPATVRFGRNGAGSWRADREELLPTSVKLFKSGVEYHLPLPGNHNLENLCAALCVCEHFGCEQTALADAVKNYEGVARRFFVTTTSQNVHVVDDFAHNPAKIIAAMRAAQGLSKRILAIYQPHGFGPTRFLKDEYIATFRTAFRQNDSLFLLPIYYAGGTAQKNISSEDIIQGLGSVAFSAQALSGRDELLSKLKATVRSGDCVLIMGARDPSLPALVKKVVELFGGERRRS